LIELRQWNKVAFYATITYRRELLMRNVLLSPVTPSRLQSAIAEWEKGPFQVETIEGYFKLQSEDCDNDCFNSTNISPREKENGDHLTQVKGNLVKLLSPKPVSGKDRLAFLSIRLSHQCSGSKLLSRALPSRIFLSLAKMGAPG
jgi:hypothetical protein